jgi:glutathione peroxidase
MGALTQKVLFKSGAEKLGGNKGSSLFDFTMKNIDG